MKLWQGIIFTLNILLMAFILPDRFGAMLLSLVPVISSIWVFIDARKIGAKDYKSRLSSWPVTLFFTTLVFWYVSLPSYLWLRYKIKNNRLEKKKP